MGGTLFACMVMGEPLVDCIGMRAIPLRGSARRGAHQARGQPQDGSAGIAAHRGRGQGKFPAFTGAMGQVTGRGLGDEVAPLIAPVLVLNAQRMADFRQVYPGSIPPPRGKPEGAGMWKSDPLMWKPLHQAKSEENQGFGGGPGGNRTHIRGFAIRRPADFPTRARPPRMLSPPSSPSLLPPCYCWFTSVRLGRFPIECQIA